MYELLDTGLEMVELKMVVVRGGRCKKENIDKRGVRNVIQESKKGGGSAGMCSESVVAWILKVVSVLMGSDGEVDGSVETPRQTAGLAEPPSGARSSA